MCGSRVVGDFDPSSPLLLAPRAGHQRRTGSSERGGVRRGRARSCSRTEGELTGEKGIFDERCCAGARSVEQKGVRVCGCEMGVLSGDLFPPSPFPPRRPKRNSCPSLGWAWPAVPLPACLLRCVLQAVQPACKKSTSPVIGRLPRTSSGTSASHSPALFCRWGTCFVQGPNAKLPTGGAT